MTVKYKIDFGNGKVFNALKTGEGYDFEDHDIFLYEKTLEIMGAKIIPIEEPITITKVQLERAMVGCFGYTSCVVWDRLKEATK